MHYPPSRREDIVDDYHGVAVADPYRWLEDGDAPEVADWVAGQNQLTRSTLDADGARPRWHQLLVERLELPLIQGVVRRGEVLFCWERPRGAEQYCLTRRAVDEPETVVVLVDPSAASVDAATALDWYEPSPDGSLIAVGVSEGGTERSTLRLISGLDGSTAGLAGDVIPDTRAASVAWESDGEGFFYTRYPDGGNYHRSVYHHRFGSDWHDDALIWSNSDEPTAWPIVELSPDDRYVLVDAMVGFDRDDVFVLDRITGEWRTVVAGCQGLSRFQFDAAGTRLIGVTWIGTGRGRIVRIDLDGALPASPDDWPVLVAEQDSIIKDGVVTADGLVVVRSTGAVDSVTLLDHDGRPRAGAATDVELGSLSTVTALGASRGHDDVYAVVDTFVGPQQLVRIDAAGVATTAVAAPPAGTDLVVDRQIYRSLDGTEIGLFLVRRTDVVAGPDTPLILNGYGGFSIARGPAWSPLAAAWCATGGVFAVAGLRGGTEHGEAWHEAGRLANKQNVFDDFHAAADHLVATGQASRERLAIYGGSNGGLLVGAALTQRPDLCAAVVCAVPLLDMIRFPQFLIAKLWVSEYGDPDDPEQFPWLWGYSPYHHVVAGTDYPATLLQTAQGDSRVDPLHARKMAAALQAAVPADSTRPILLLQEERAGHGVGKPVHKLADTSADMLTFVGAQTGLRP